MRRFVFICHASEDAGTAAAIVESLERRGIGCWVAPRNVPLGAQYAQAIVAGISGADALVLVFSDHANRSPHVAREAERAVSRGVPIFPVRVSDDTPSAALEYFISSAQWLDISTGDLEEHLSELATRLGELMHAGEESPARVGARDALHQAIARLGPGLADDPRRVEAILRDLAGDHRAEVAALSVAAAEGVGSALLTASAGMHEGLIEKLTQRLQNNRGLAADGARWAVETWGQVLGVAGQMAPPGMEGETVPVGERGSSPLLEAEIEPEPPSMASPPPTEPVISPVPDGLDLEAETPETPAASEEIDLDPEAPAAPPRTVPATSPESLAATIEAGEVSPPSEPDEGAQTLPLAPDGDTSDREAVRLTHKAPKDSAKRWRAAAGVGMAVVAISVVGFLVAGGPDDTSNAAGTTTTAGATTTAGVPTTTGVTTTMAGVATTDGVTNGTVPTGTGRSGDPYRLPYIEEFGSSPSGFWDVPRLTENASWDIVGEALTLEVRAASVPTWVPHFDLPDSFVVSMDVSPPRGDDVGCGIVFEGPGTSRLLFMVNSAEEKYDVSRSDGSGGWESLVPSYRTGYHPAIRGGEGNRIELVVLGAEMAFRLNGDTVLHLSGTDFTPPTAIGPAARMLVSDTVECSFDSFTVAQYEAAPPADVTTSCPFGGQCPTLPYLESFDSRDWVEPWGIESSPLGTYDWDIVAGQLSLDADRTGTEADFFRHRMTTFFGLPSSYVVSLDVSQTTAGGVSCGLSLNHQGDSFYRFDYLIDSANQEFSVWGPQSRVDYSRAAVVPPTYDSRIRQGDVNRVELVVDGQELAFKVNGETLAEWTRGFTSLPQIGPAARVEPGAAEECRFDNYAVEAGN